MQHSRHLSIQGKTVFITGASSGIGLATAWRLAEEGAHLIITARRKERLDKLASEIKEKCGVKCLSIALDVRDKEQVDAAVQILENKQIEIDILINNAGLALTTDKLYETHIESVEQMIDTNVKGLLYITKAFLPNMVKKDQGHIVNIGSIAGRGCYAGGSVYCATKYAVRGISQALRYDLAGTSIRVSEIVPGAVETEFSIVRWNDKQKADNFYKGFTPLNGEDIADTIWFCLTRPLHVNVSELVVYPQAQVSLHELVRKNK